MRGMSTASALAAAALTTVLSAPLVAAPQDPEAARVDFVTQILPIFQARCVECHGADEPEAELRLDVRAGLFGPDAYAEMVIPGNPDDSLVYQRIVLPADDPDIMPAEGDPLTKAQIALVKQWIEQGADWPEGAGAAEASATSEEDALVLAELDEAALARRDEALAALRERGALALQVAANTQAVEVSFGLLGAEVTDQDLALLDGLQTSLVWLDLSRTSITDAATAKLEPFTELRRLNLSNTAIGDAAIESLAALTELRYLNLYGTKVGDAGLEPLGRLQQLRKLFLWQTAVTEAAADALAEKLPQTRIDRGGYVEVMQEIARASAPVNDKCLLKPDKDIDPAYTFKHGETNIGFCCANCRSKFAANPEEFADQLAALGKAPASTEDGLFNAVCPVSGDAADAAHTVSHDDKTVGFCCARCKARFEADPTAYADKIRAK